MAFVSTEDIPDYKKAHRLEGIVGASGVHATCGDLLLWQEGLLKGRVLTQASLREMIAPQITANFARMQNYGFGIGVNSAFDETMLFHLGGWGGYASSLLHFQKSDITIIVLTNNDSETGVADGIAAILHGQVVHIPERHLAVDLPPTDLVRFLGKYVAGPQSFRIVIESGTLVRVGEDGTKVVLKAESPTKIFYDDGSDRQIEFQFTGGQVSKVVFIKEGRRIELKKVQD